ncbi:MAG: [Clostridia bacterium]|nr:[FeFe] hydrogenase H-cluster maturation GTPase HydF [Clostridia bacterium]
MGLNDAPAAERIHIGFFGCTNAGKSSVVNAVTGQDLAIVSDVSGTTTDPVLKTMELLPLGPVVIIDTAGIDDTGELGRLRMKKSRDILRKTDIAILVADAKKGLSPADRALIEDFKRLSVPYIVAFNKCDLLSRVPTANEGEIYVSAKSGENIEELKERIAALKPEAKEKPLIADKLSRGDIVILVVPIDKSAPKGRLILPQQQTIRDILGAGALSLVTGVSELSGALSLLSGRVRMVITDSQVFSEVSRIVPHDVPLCSFSILFARFKGDLKTLAGGASVLKSLPDGARVLISEGCTHHRQCEDIGTVKLPDWIRKYSGRDIKFEFTSGGEFPDDLSRFSLVVHCGGCMLNEREMKHRIARAKLDGVPITNYGTAIAEMKGILKRSLEIFPQDL